ncbi:hypothetical protein J1N35_036229, partial [Gossypium stocksii]
RQQVFLAVKTYQLQSFLDLHAMPPPQMITDADGMTQENVEFVGFKQQDCAPASWLLYSTTSNLMFYHRALYTQRKGDLSMKEFLMKIKLYCGNLASCREIISEHEHVTAILNGLPPEYEAIISIIITSQLPYSVQHVTTMLFDAEARQQVIVSEVMSSANLVSQQPSESMQHNSPPTYRSSAPRGCGCGRSSGGKCSKLC